MVLSDPVLEVLRREVRRLSPDVRVECEELRSVLESEVLKRDVLESEKAGSARKQVVRAAGRLLRIQKQEAQEAPNEAAAPTEGLPA